MADFERLKHLVENWANNRGLLFKGNQFRQHEKLEEEVKELKQALINEDIVNTEEEIGDCLVVLINMAKVMGLDILQCLQTAYDKINCRTGKTVNGIFIKD